MPNGMIGSVYVSFFHVSDPGLLNMSNLNSYLINLSKENNISLPSINGELPAIYEDGIFPMLPTILPRFSNPTVNESRTNTRLASVQQNIPIAQ